MRTTLTIDDDVAAQLEKENQRASEPMKQTVNRLLRSGLAHSAKPAKPKRFVVKPLDTKLTSSDWKNWNESSLEDGLFANSRRKAA